MRPQGVLVFLTAFNVQQNLISLDSKITQGTHYNYDVLELIISHLN